MHRNKLDPPSCFYTPIRMCDDVVWRLLLFRMFDFHRISFSCGFTMLWILQRYVHVMSLAFCKKVLFNLACSRAGFSPALATFRDTTVTPSIYPLALTQRMVCKAVWCTDVDIGADRHLDRGSWLATLFLRLLRHRGRLSTTNSVVISQKFRLSEISKRMRWKKK